MSNAKILLNEGDIFFNEGKFEEAVKKYSEALEFDPFFKTAFFKQLQAKSKLGIAKNESFYGDFCVDNTSQLATYKKSRWVYRGVIVNTRDIDEKSLAKEKKDQLAHKPDAFFLFYNGFLLRKKGEFKKSIEFLKAGLSIQPNYPNAWFVMGLSFDSQYMHNDATNAYKNGVNSCIDGTFFYENEPEGWNNFGYGLGMIDRYSEAISALDTALSFKFDQKLASIQETALLNKAYSMNQIENFDEVLRICDTILSINPKNEFAIPIKKLTSERIDKQKNKKWWSF